MQLTGLYGITDDRLLPAERLCAAVEAALEAGMAMLQYRSKTGSPELRRQQAESLQALCARYRVPLIINDDVALCAAVGAAGVHLGADDPSPGAARATLGPDAIIGATCHASLPRALEAQAAGADYVAFGRFYPSRSKPGASPASPEILAAAKRELTIPLVAIGGINPDNGAALIAAGADMLAVIHALFGSDDVRAAATRLTALFTQ